MSDRGHYVRHRTRIVRGFDWLAKRLERSLSAHYDAAFAADVIARARRELDDVIPSLPYIGGLRNIFTWVIIVNGYIVALHRAMRAHGKSAEETIRIVAEVSDQMFRSWPTAALRVTGRLAFSRAARRTLRKQAERSQQRRYPADFVYAFREGGDDDWALVFDECAVNKFYDAEDLQDLKPYCNFFDVTYSRLMNMGVDARETIGLGCEKCSLRYKHGRETVVPPELDGVVPPAGGAPAKS